MKMWHLAFYSDKNLDKNLKERQIMRKIILLCASGMSTSLLVTQMQKYSEEINYSCEISAFAFAEAKSNCEDASIILLGPQVRYQLSSIKRAYPNSLVESIDMMAYGMMDGKKVVNHVKEVLGD